MLNQTQFVFQKFKPRSEQSFFQRHFFVGWFLSFALFVVFWDRLQLIPWLHPPGYTPLRATDMFWSLVEGPQYVFGWAFRSMTGTETAEVSFPSEQTLFNTRMIRTLRRLRRAKIVSSTHWCNTSHMDNEMKKTALKNSEQRPSTGDRKYARRPGLIKNRNDVKRKSAGNKLSFMSLFITIQTTSYFTDAVWCWVLSIEILNLTGQGWNWGVEWRWVSLVKKGYHLTYSGYGHYIRRASLCEF